MSENKQNETIKKILEQLEKLTPEQLKELEQNFQKNSEPVKDAWQKLEQKTRDDIFNENKKERKKHWSRIILGAIFGGAVVLMVMFFIDKIADWSTVISIGWFYVFIFVTVLLGGWILFKNSILYRVFGVGKASYEAIYGTLAEPLKEIIKSRTDKKEDFEKIEPKLNAIDQSIRQLIAYFSYSRTRNWLFTLFFSLLLGLFAFLGTHLLVRQNDLLVNQNKLMKEQSHLTEAARRSSLVFMMSNIMDKVDEELGRKGVEDKPYHISRKLSDVTIGRIAALSHGLKPIKYLEFGRLTKEPTSPEKGQLLLSLINSRLDSIDTYQKVFEKAHFSGSELRSAILNEAFIDGIILSNSLLGNSQFERAFLLNAKIRNAEFNNSNFKDATLRDVDFFGSNMIRTVFYKSKIKNINFHDVNLNDAYLVHSELNNVSFGPDLNHKELETLVGLPPDSEELESFLKNIDHRLEYPAKIKATNFANSKIRETVFFHLDMKETIFARGDLQNLKIVKANLNRSDFSNRKYDITSIEMNSMGTSVSAHLLPDTIETYDGANLSNALIIHSNAVNADFTNCILTNAKLRWTNFSGALFCAANLENTDLTGADLTGADLRQALFFKTNFFNTKLNLARVENRTWIEDMEKQQVRGIDYIKRNYFVDSELRFENSSEVSFKNHPFPHKSFYILQRK